MKTYNIPVTRDGKCWMIDVPAFDGLTQARKALRERAWPSRSSRSPWTCRFTGRSERRGHNR